MEIHLLVSIVAAVGAVISAVVGVMNYFRQKFSADATASVAGKNEVVLCNPAAYPVVLRRVRTVKGTLREVQGVLHDGKPIFSEEGPMLDCALVLEPHETQRAYFHVLVEGRRFTYSARMKRMGGAFEFELVLNPLRPDMQAQMQDDEECVDQAQKGHFAGAHSRPPMW